MAQNTQACGHCGASNTHTEQFCENCGYELAGPVTSTIVSNSNNTATVVSVAKACRITGALMAGNTLGGRYRIVEMIGKGGFGAVYKARDERFPSKPVVALKEMSDSQLSPSERAQVLKDFHNEADLLVQLKHPNLPKVNDVFEDGGKAYLVMEFIEGKTLEQLQNEQNDPLDEQQVMDWALQLCTVLRYLHTRPQPIVFRDMKPANVMVTADGEVKLIDFGIARIFKAAVKKDTTLLGSQGYAPLEQYGHGQSDARSDIYALGATLYDLLTKELPADAPSRRINPTLFSTPRQLNPKISPAVEAVILKAMADEPKDRYQTTADMYQAIDATGLVATSSSSPKPLPPPPVTPPVQPQPQGKRPAPVRNRKRLVLLTGLLILLLALVLSVVWRFLPAQTTSPINLPPAVEAVPAPDGELIGLSDGKYVFDTTSPAADLKKQAAQQLQQGNTGAAISLLSEAHKQETSDAEVLIYQENLRVINGNYITLVLGTTLTGTSSAIGIGHDDLQGAYVAQREYNDTADQHGGIKVRLLIANTGSKTEYVSPVAKQIVSVAQQDKTIVGVVGWDLSAQTFAAITPLTQAHVPMASIAAGDNFTGISKYFFRANAPAALQAMVGAKYALQTMKATSAAIFVDPANDYTRSLADDFKANFVGKGPTIVATESYTVGDASTRPAELEKALQDALHHHPDIIYFAGYPQDVSVLLQHLRPSDPPVIGGNALYELGGYPHVTPAGLSHLRFTALAYPDEWDILGLSAQKPAFFKDYPKIFDDGNHQENPYGYTRADSGTMLDYDATMAFLQASTHLIENKESLTANEIQQALAGLTGPNALQGVTGQLAFGPDGNPINKAVTVVCYKDGFKLDVVVGQFLLNEAPRTEYPGTSVCA